MPVVVLFHTIIQNGSTGDVASGKSFIRVEFEESSRGRSRGFHIGVEIVDGRILGNMTAEVTGEQGTETAMMNQLNPLPKPITKFAVDWANQYHFKMKTSGSSCGIIKDDT